MKKLTTIFAASILLISANAFTPPPDSVSNEIKTAFEKIFSSAFDVSWKKVNDYYLATFQFDEHEATAAYNKDGQLISASRMLTLSQLPLNISLALQNQYPEYTFENLVSEIMKDGQNNYYIKGESEKKIVILKANGSGALTVESKTKK